MATLTQMTVSSLIEETLAYLQRTNERPRQIRLAADLSSSGTSVTVSGGDEALAPTTTVIEIGSELMLVTNTGSNTLVVSRGYADTTPVAHTQNAPILINPQFPRREVLRRVSQFFTTVANTYLPRYETATLSPSSDALAYVQLPSDTVEVTEVRFFSASAGRIVHLGNWEMHEDLDVADFPSGKVLMVSSMVSTGDELIVTYIVPHQAYSSDGSTEIAWSALAESSVVKLSFGSETLPAMYAAACLITGREVSRLEIDHIEEWNQDEAIRQGIPVRYINLLWQQFYRGLDEARRLQYRPKHRPYRKMPTQGIF